MMSAQRTEAIMHWYDYVAYFLGGTFLANFVPHFTNGISGRKFQTPFAKPPGKGLSSSTVNVLWGLLNLALAYVLIVQVGSFNPRDVLQVAAVLIGMLFVSLNLARHFGQFHGGL
jgi:hypothetical protein